MDAYLKKEQIGTLFVWVGAPEGGGRGWVVGQGGPAQKLGMPDQIKFLTAAKIMFLGGAANSPPEINKYMRGCGLLRWV
jgi:hypothetical protein